MGILKRYSLVMAALLAGIGGCAPTQQEMQRAEYGQVPTNYEVFLFEDIKKTLHDPDTAKIKIGTPYKALATVRGKYRYGHVVEAVVNAKNVMGFSIGDQTEYYFFLSDGELVKFLQPPVIVKPKPIE